jgi:hypothetical protein
MNSIRLDLTQFDRHLPSLLSPLPSIIRSVCRAHQDGRESCATESTKLVPTKTVTNATTEANVFWDSKTSMETNSSFVTVPMLWVMLESIAKLPLNKSAAAAVVITTQTAMCFA